MQHAAETHAATPDYTRELLFGITLLVTMSHEKAETLTNALTALTPTLAKNPHLGGYAGEGALYTMIIVKTTPIAYNLDACNRGGGSPAGPCSDQFGRLSSALRTMLGSLAQRLAATANIDHLEPGDEHDASSVATHPPSPWPAGEDSGLEGARVRIRITHVGATFAHVVC